MNTIIHVILNIIIMLALVYGIVWMQKKHLSFTKRVLTALVVGILYGAVLQITYGVTSPVVIEANNWFSIIGSGYVRLLKMIVMPLIFVSISTAIINQNSKNLGKKAGTIIAVLVITAAMSAAIGAFTAGAFGLNANGIQAGEAQVKEGKELDASLTEFKETTVQQQIVEIIPTNPFYSLTGQGSSATLSVVLFAGFLGIATVAIKKKNRNRQKPLLNFKCTS